MTQGSVGRAGHPEQSHWVGQNLHLDRKAQMSFWANPTESQPSEIFKNTPRHTHTHTNSYIKNTLRHTHTHTYIKAGGWVSTEFSAFNFQNSQWRNQNPEGGDSADRARQLPRGRRAPAPQGVESASSPGGGERQLPRRRRAPATQGWRAPATQKAESASSPEGGERQLPRRRRAPATQGCRQCGQGVM